MTSENIVATHREIDPRFPPNRPKPDCKNSSVNFQESEVDILRAHKYASVLSLALASVLVQKMV